MKKQIFKFIIILTILLLNCHLDYAQVGYKWTQKSSMPAARAGAVAFTVKNSAYVGAGSSGSYLNDFYKYDILNDTWSQISGYANSLPGAGSMSNNSIGLVGLGTVTHTDCYTYDSLTNMWNAAANFGGSGRYDVSTFTIGNKGYLCGGIDNVVNYNDLWEYDFSANTWTQKASMPCGTRYACFSFSIGGKGYVGGGCYDNNTHYSDFYEYDPTTDTWTQKANFGGGLRSFASGFSIINKGFAGIGRNGFGGTNLLNDFWTYDPTSDTWSQIDSFPGTPRVHAISFSNNDLGYVGTGVNPNLSNTYFSDLWELDTLMPAPTPTPCNANFSIFPDSNIVGLYFGYNYSSGTNFTCTWNWGDNTIDTGMYPIHYYQNSGTYNISLSVNGVLCKDTINVNYPILRSTSSNGIHKVTILKPGTVLGTDIQENNTKINIYPNPTKDVLNFEIGKFGKSKVEVYKLNGEKVLSVFTTSNSVNIKKLDEGMYIVEITGDDGYKFRSHFIKTQ